ncbi:MAG: sigma-70 family RNA polymerase sigma factor [Deltaproteobacteria bacterium]|nr:MAG: sigma-70 family RNA polymerase sigma factor [Deltaproteobacteria bacterium]
MASIPPDDAPEDAGDRELVDRARDGDADAFRVLFERYRRRAYAAAYGMLHNADDALDVVQEAFIKAHRHLGTFQGNASFYTWLYRIVMNLCIDHIRRRKRARHVDFDDAIGHDEADAPVGEEALLPRMLDGNPQRNLARRQVREYIAEALETLSDNHRAVIILRELEGMSYEEMAQAMQCAKGTIMSRLFHARRNLQKRLLELMGGETDLKV